MRKRAAGADLDLFSVFLLKNRIPGAVSSIIKGTETKQAVDMLCLVAGIICTGVVFKIP